MEAEIATQAVGLASSTDFSLINLFLRADIVVKSVIIILILASIYSWALIFNKYRLFNRIHKSSSIFEDKFWSSKSAEGFYKSLPSKTKDPIANIFRSAMVELIKSKSKNNDIQTARVTRVVEISSDQEIQSIEKNFSFLATVGATAPFIGLFGTVWGIMNSFQSIAISRNTSLAIVAPGIAEALFATALGLLAAIPASHHGIKIAHLEAGMRSYDYRMPEEKNRIIIDHLSSILLPYTQYSRENLIRENIHPSKIFVVGNPIIEVINSHIKKINSSKILD